MRVLLVEQKWGVHTDKGTPITYQVTEQWESLSTATEVVEKSLEKDGLTWRTRKLAADVVEIDVQDADDTLIGLWDADALEKKTGPTLRPTARSSATTAPSKDRSSSSSTRRPRCWSEPSPTSSSTTTTSATTCRRRTDGVIARLLDT